MEQVQFSDALRLSGLADSQLREWCGKRGLFQPTVPARGPGRLALYSWHDIIALRIFREIFSTFGGKASGWAIGIADLRGKLEGQFFPNLWGKSVVFIDQSTARVERIGSIERMGAVLIVPLDPHLAVLADGSTPDDLQGQLPLVTSVRTGR
jgi:hypothetical protein